MAIFSVIVVTAPPPGQGAEAGGPFVKVDNREALLRSIELFLNREHIKQVQVAFLPDKLEEAKRKFGGHLALTGVKMLSAGPRWIDQLAAANEKIADDVTHVIVHDGARPAVPYSDIDALQAAAEKSTVVALATPSRCGLVEVDEGGAPVALHTSERFMQLLTPQAFTRARFAELAKSRQEPHASEMTIVKGSPLNIRVGGAGDATLVKAMLNMLPKPKLRAPDNPFEEAQW
ncbi:MAG TPA: 2-C-methyl-D-erythritol 4-phosphate cytidylyltransferase [Tepidisphaeraceae bacterium]|jgi:2-C-methyl-D-erythritol 4-phosphate cytidylyltransferase/2-C-methyl-D-erythritol 2,4-cyclodiphosphate synthase